MLEPEEGRRGERSKVGGVEAEGGEERGFGGCTESGATRMAVGWGRDGSDADNHCLGLTQRGWRVGRR